MSRGPTVRRVALAALTLSLAASASAPAWLVPGHRRVAVDAVRVLPLGVPAFFRDQAEEIGRAAADPDYWRNRDSPALADEERPRHYLDLELLDGTPLPELRSEFLRLLAKRGLEAPRVGLLPFALIEEFERLTLCFAQWRLQPGQPGLEASCRLFAGHLAHYAADLEQPLHTTVHHDGWTLPDGDPPFSGIHRRVDRLFDAASFDAGPALACVVPHPLHDPWATVRDELAKSHSLVDRVYVLEIMLRAPDGGAGDPEVIRFTSERYRAAAEFVSSLFWTAWERSARVDVPSWALSSESSDGE